MSPPLASPLKKAGAATGGESYSRVEAGSRSLHSTSLTSVPMRFTSGRSWASQFCSQKSPGQVGEAPHPQWLGRSVLCLSRNPRDKRANRVVPHRRKETRWSNTRPMAEQQVFMLGCDGHMPSGRIVRHWVRPRGRCCSGTRRFSQRGKICQHWKRIPIAVETLGPINTSACQLFANLGRLKISSASGDDREGAFLFQRVSVLVQGYNAVLTPCQPLTAWTNDQYTQLCIILIFKLSREHIYRG